ncbi:tetratricopeptide repeat protein [Chromobacterium haemolyticum]|uniref:tetratricopeptide repeat protein n=1 Tax=Chromobacterium haemolyticum TaxID=394935 RepID=UPI0005BE3EC2|nr:tetratricopeptide repeat protein [Chromobacterium haemolyticum]
MSSKRERLCPLWLSIFIGVGVILALVAAYPRGGVRAYDLMSRPPSELSVAYLEAWLRVRPDEPSYLELLASQHLRLGRWEAAMSAANNLARVGSGEERQRALLLQVDAAEQMAYAVSPQDKRREMYMASYRVLLQRTLRYEWDAQVMTRLATQATAAGAADVMLTYYHRLAGRDPGHAMLWQEKIGKLALSQRAYEQSAQAFFAAFEHAATLEDKRRNFIAGLKVLASAGKIAQACAEGDRRGAAMMNDPASLRVLLDQARQCGRPDLSTRYAKALTQLVLHTGGAATPRREAEPAQRAQSAHKLGTAKRPTPSPSAAPAQQTGGLESDLELAYQAFIESGQLNDAQSIAQQALGRHFNMEVWTKRLAQVAQWNNHPDLALRAWLQVARGTDNDAAWQNVLTLAPQLHDDQAYLAAQMHAARAKSADLSQKVAVVDTLERLGRPDEALTYLQQNAAGSMRRPMLEKLAEVAERVGQDGKALATYQTLQSEFGPTPGYAMHIANLEYRHGDFSAALDALTAARDIKQEKADAAAFWRTYAQLAQLTQRRQDVDLGNERLIATGLATDADLHGMIYSYQDYPLDAGRIAELEFRKNGSEAALLLALTNYTAAAAWPRIRNLLHKLTLEQASMLSHSSALLAARAEYYRQRQYWKGALADLRRAVRQADVTDEIRVQYLWMLVDFGRNDELTAALHRWRGQAQEDSTYWGAYGAGELRLGHAASALSFLRRQSTLADDDPLWTLSLAEAEDAAGHSMVAWTLRSKVWRELQAKSRDGASGDKPNIDQQGYAGDDGKTPPKPAAQLETQAARVRLSQSFAGGDYSRNLLASLLKRDGGQPAQLAETLLDSTLIQALGSEENEKGAPPADAAPRKPALRAVARETMLAWAVSGEYNELARAWLTRQYARWLLRPADARATLAIADNDRDTLSRILDGGDGSIPIRSAIEALDRIGRVPQAQTLAFDAHEGAPDNDAAHQTMSDLLLRDPPSFGADIIAAKHSPVDSLDYVLIGSVPLTSRYGLGLKATDSAQHLSSATQLAWIPSHDRMLNLTVSDVTSERRLAITLGTRQALNSFGTASLYGEFNRDGALGITFNAGIRQYANNSAELNAAGTKDMLRLGLDMSKDARWFWSGSYELDRFHAQDGSFLGTGWTLSGNVGYRIRSTYPDWSIRLVGERSAYASSDSQIPSLSVLLPPGRAPQTSYFMPTNATQFGLMMGLGLDQLMTAHNPRDEPHPYWRSWRPFMDAGIVHQSAVGWRPEASIGMSGPVAGNDQARLYFSHEPAVGRNAASTQVGVSYRMFY